MSASAGSVEILHVDDEPDFAEMAVEFLERESERFNVETAADASDGYDRLIEGDFDCIVSDYDMPGENGIEFLEAVRRDFPDLPFILFTGKGSEGVASEAISAGVTDYLQKEGGTEQYAVLANRIQNVVARHRAEGRYRELVETAPVPMFVYDDDQILYANQAAADFFCADSPADLLGVDPIELIDPDDAERVRERAGRVINQRETPEPREIGLIALNGERRSAIGTGTPVMFEGRAAAQVIFRDVTGQRERQQDVDLFRNLIDHSTDEIYIVDPETTEIVDANQTACRRLDCSHAELVGTSITDIVDVSGHETPQAVIGILDDQPGTFEGRHERTDGTTYPVESSVSRATVDDRSYLIVIARDITDRKERERELREREKRFRTLFEQTADSVFLHDPEGRFIDVNRQASANLGYDREELIGMTVWDISIGSEPEDVAERWTDMAAGETAVFEGVHQRADGSTFPVDIRVARVDLGDEDQFIAIARDVSAREERKSELERTERQFEAVFNSPNTWSLVLAPDGTVLDVNQTALDFIDADRADIAGELFWETPWWTTHFDGPTKADQRDVQEQVERAADGDYVELGGKHVGPEGQVVYVEGELRPVIDEGGIVVAIVADARDVTDRKERERELRRQNERLDEFASVVSHDLRNPLGVASGRLELAMDECESQHLESIAQAHARMESIIEDTLALAQAGQTIGETDRVDLSDLIDSCWRTVETDSATLVTETDRAIEADDARLRQLLENLFRNAIEHGGAGVTVTVGDLPDGFYVEDDGPGIPEHEREAVLEPGFSTTEAGTGFGLGIVREIADAHSWDIEVTSGTDAGARFEFTGVRHA